MKNVCKFVQKKLKFFLQIFKTLGKKSKKTVQILEGGFATSHGSTFFDNKMQKQTFFFGGMIFKRHKDLRLMSPLHRPRGIR
jgi:hypothetical protein